MWHEAKANPPPQSPAASQLSTLQATPRSAPGGQRSPPMTSRAGSCPAPAAPEAPPSAPRPSRSGQAQPSSSGPSLPSLPGQLVPATPASSPAHADPPPSTARNFAFPFRQSLPAARPSLLQPLPAKESPEGSPGRTHADSARSGPSTAASPFSSSLASSRLEEEDDDRLSSEAEEDDSASEHHSSGSGLQSGSGPESEEEEGTEGSESGRGSQTEPEDEGEHWGHYAEGAASPTGTKASLPCICLVTCAPHAWLSDHKPAWAWLPAACMLCPAPARSPRPPTGLCGATSCETLPAGCLQLLSASA